MIDYDDFYGNGQDPDIVVRTSSSAWDALEQRMVESAKAALSLRTRMTVTEWAESRRTIAASESQPMPGPWSQANNPVARVPQDAMSDPETREWAWMAAAQTGKSAALTNFTGWKIELEPGPIMVAYPNENTAIKKVKEDFAPMFRDVQVLADRVHNADVDKFNRTTMRRATFPGGSFATVSAESDTEMASSPMEAFVLDERGRIKNTKEGDPRSAGRKRGTRFPNFKLLSASTPVGKGCPMSKDVEEGCMSVPLVKCVNPDCTDPHFQMLFSTIQIPRVELRRDDGSPMLDDEGKQKLGEMIPQEAYVACPSCGHAHYDGDRYRAIDGTVWRQTKPWYCCGRLQDPMKIRKWDYQQNGDGIACCGNCGKHRPKRSRSFHKTPVQYAKLPLAPVVQEWKDAQGDAGKLMQFWNQGQGESWTIDLSAKKTSSMLKERREEYFDEATGQMVDVPSGVKSLYASIDVNPSYGLDMLIKGFGDGEETWDIRYLRALGRIDDFTASGPWAAVDGMFGSYAGTEWVPRNYSGVDDRIYRVTSVFCDIGAEADIVMRYVKPRMNRRATPVVPIRGRGNGPLWTPHAEFNQRHRHPHFPIGTNVGKTILMARLRIPDPGPGYMHFPADQYDQDNNIVASSGFPESYLDELMNLKTIETKNPSTGQSKDGFGRIEKAIREEAPDLNVYVMAACRADFTSKGYQKIDDMPPSWRKATDIDRAEFARSELMKQLEAVSPTQPVAPTQVASQPFRKPLLPAITGSKFGRGG